MPPRLVLFDVDGTLVDTAGAGRIALGAAFGRVFSVDGFESRTAGVRYAGATDPRIIEALTDALGITRTGLAASLDALLECYFDLLREQMARHDPRRRVLPGVRALLEDLARRDDVHLGLLTGNFERGARIKLEPFGLNRYFPDGGFSSDHPDRRAIARSARDKLSARAGIAFPPERVIVVGDTEIDVDCAHANGFRAIALSSGWVPRQVLEGAEPDFLFDTLEDLPAVLEALGLTER